jgi:hypothetical protein
MRPLALQNELNRTPSAGSKARSWVSWFCKKETASLPLTSITPKWDKAQLPKKLAGGVGMDGCMTELSSRALFL